MEDITYAVPMDAEVGCTAENTHFIKMLHWSRFLVKMFVVFVTCDRRLAVACSTVDWN